MSQDTKFRLDSQPSWTIAPPHVQVPHAQVFLLCFRSPASKQECLAIPDHSWGVLTGACAVARAQFGPTYSKTTEACCLRCYPSVFVIKDAAGSCCFRISRRDHHHHHNLHNLNSLSFTSQLRLPHSLLSKQYIRFAPPHHNKVKRHINIFTHTHITISV